MRIVTEKDGEIIYISPRIFTTPREGRFAFYIKSSTGLELNLAGYKFSLRICNVNKNNNYEKSLKRSSCGNYLIYDIKEDDFLNGELFDLYIEVETEEAKFYTYPVGRIKIQNE